MHDMSAHAAHHHAPRPASFGKHVFSLDHKVIGKQYYGLALVARLHRHGAFLADAHPPGLDELRHSRAALAFQERRPRRRDDAGVSICS